MSSERLIQTKQMRSGCPSTRHSSNIPTFRTTKFANLDRYAGSSLQGVILACRLGKFVVGVLDYLKTAVLGRSGLLFITMKLKGIKVDID